MLASPMTVKELDGGSLAELGSDSLVEPVLDGDGVDPLAQSGGQEGALGLASNLDLGPGLRGRLDRRLQELPPAGQVVPVSNSSSRPSWWTAPSRAPSMLPAGPGAVSG
jgi:hypothetical protein